MKEIKRIVVYNIDWDEGDEWLPTKLSINITDDTKCLLEDIEGYAQNLTDYLSDCYGYCVNDYCIKCLREGEF